MSFPKKRLLADPVLLPLLLFLFSCGSLDSQRSIDSVSAAWLSKDSPPPTVAVMPFDNLTSDEEIGALMRKSFYNHFSSKNYKDIELNVVDRGLESIQKARSGAWRDVPPESLGKSMRISWFMEK